MASASVASGAPLRILSRRASALRARRAPKNQQGGGSDGGGGAATSAAKKDDTAWPKSIRYAFYVSCAVAVPYGAGTAVAENPALRDALLPDGPEPPPRDANDGPADAAAKGSKASVWDAAALKDLIRSHWGVEEYAPPIDRPEISHIRPSSGDGDSGGGPLSSVLTSLTFGSKGETTASGGGGIAVPMSFANELPLSERLRQAAIDAHLSPSRGDEIKVRVTTVRRADFGSGGDEIIEGEAVAKIPAGASLRALRGGDGEGGASLPEEWRSALENLGGSDGKVRFALDFAPSDDHDDDGRVSAKDTDHRDDYESFLQENGISLGVQPQGAAVRWRRNTSIYSAWARLAQREKSGADSGVGGAAGEGASAAPDAEQLRGMRLEHEISTLEREYRDPSSLRDRDAMMEELTSARKELKEFRRRRRRENGDGLWKSLW